MAYETTQIYYPIIQYVRSLKSVSPKAAPEIKVLVDLCSFWESKKESASLPFPASRNCLHSLACDNFLHHQGKVYNSIFALWPLLPNLYLLSLIVLLPSFKDHCDYIKPTRVMETSLLTSKSLIQAQFQSSFYLK